MIVRSARPMLHCSFPWTELPDSTVDVQNIRGGVWNLPAGVEVQPLPQTSGAIRGIMTVPLCPDMLNYQKLGAADSFRGRLIRGFFRLLDFTPW